ncbi:MAG: hypothetical protein JW827_11720 [Spirochaetes bacterium]|nr:hypothetical protein [Spirochaetota bacterium]
MTLTVEVYKKNKEFIAKCKELNLYSYGQSSEKAVQRLHKIINFYLQSADEYLEPFTDKVKLPKDPTIN